MLWLCGALMVAAGLPQYGYGVLVATLARTHGWSLGGALWALITFVVVQAAVAYPVASLRAGGRFSPRPPVIGGGVLCAAGMAAVAHTGTVAVVVVGYGVCCGIGAGLVYMTCLSVVARWYPEQSAGRIGVLTGAFAGGAVPFAVVLLAGGPGATRAFLDGAAGAVLLVAVVCGVLLREPPRNWWPPHIDPRSWAVDKRVNRSLRRNRYALRTFRPREALRSGTFGAIYGLVIAACAVSLFDLAYLAVMATKMDFSVRVVAASFAGLIGVTGLARVVAARLSDRVGRRQVLAGVLLVGGLAQLLLLLGATHGSTGMLLAGVCCAGLGAGCGIPLCAALVRDYFGAEAALQNFAIVYSAKAIGAVCGIGLAAAAGGAPMVLVGVAGLALVAAATAVRLRQPGRPAVRLP